MPRLAANITAGHIILSLLGSLFIFLSGRGKLPALFSESLHFFYYSFEVAICLVQAMIFSLLLFLYSSEYPDQDPHLKLYFLRGL